MLEGDLGDFTLPDILRLLAFTSKTGRLTLQEGGAVGRIDVRDGRVRDASPDATRLVLARRLLGRGALDGAALRALLPTDGHVPSDHGFARLLVEHGAGDPAELAEVLREHTTDAVFDLLRWERGSFHFDGTGASADEAPEISLEVDELLSEVAARLEAWPHVAGRTGAGDAVVSIVRPDDPEVRLDRDGWQLLGLIDGHRTIDELVALAGRGQFETRRTLLALLDAGVAAVTGPDGGVARLLDGHQVLEALESQDSAVARPEPPVATPPAPTEPIQPGRDFEAADVVEPADVAEPADLVEPAEVAETAGVVEPAAVVDPSGGFLPPPPPTDPPVKQLRTDPDVDPDLVGRLIDGVEKL